MTESEGTMRDIILELLKLTIMITTMLITRYAIPWIKAKTENETMQVIIDLVTQAVLAAEQFYKEMPGPERKAIVTKFIKQILEQKNIDLSDEEIDVMIEAAVKQMNVAKELGGTGAHE